MNRVQPPQHSQDKCLTWKECVKMSPMHRREELAIVGAVAKKVVSVSVVKKARDWDAACMKAV